jgi:hypothetical protein
MGEERKDREWIILTYTASVYEDGIRNSLNCWIIEVWGDRERVKEWVNLIKVQYIHVWNTTAKPLWTLNICLKNEEQECKTDPVRGGWQWEGEGEWKRWRRVNMLVFFIYLYENKTVKIIEIILSGGGVERMMVGTNLIKVHYNHICKYHSENPLYI